MVNDMRFAKSRLMVNDAFCENPAYGEYTFRKNVFRKKFFRNFVHSENWFSE